MNNFDFRTVPTLINRYGASAQLGEIIQQHFPAVRRVVLVTDPGFLATGLVQLCVQSLESAGLSLSLYAEVQADPSEQLILTARASLQAQQPELVIGMGGGSSLDVAKLLAVLLNSSQILAQMYGIDQIQGTRLPLIQIPTTAGTGSEVTPIAIVTTGASSKMGIIAPQLYADIAILDAALTLGLPTSISAATGIDAMVHAIEAYTSKHKKNPLSDMLARQALQLLWGNLEEVCNNGQNLDARQAILLGAMLAGQAFANAPVAAVHALAYPLGGIFHLPHGLSNALVLPHVLRFNLPFAATEYAELASIIVPQASGSEQARSQAMIDALAALPQRVGIANRLRQVGITECDLDTLAQAAMQQTRLLANNPRELTLADARAIYTAAL
ncbi:iron-containing alcohol dehydrogenase [Undibacterium sp.]|uniref:iron-containing alcohol dehydrogenase n=1 Tax=Undibacterium sp. TaxID=1914977 RepID=UPI0025E6845A|nr:iron-containing alcohol dehydrogenase [Undibacterium sp.]